MIETNDILLTEMLIVGLLTLFATGWSIGLIINHHNDKDWESPLLIIKALTIFIIGAAIIFEIIWYLKYLGLDV